ncbi:MAG: PCRF domain-containing protein, partial [Candidatus Omnitrophica bacterium]|nr:PCRF domain-containing protein [Candidatus Omnitrophota bacterium]
MNQPDFWDDQEKSNKLMKELKYLKSCVEPFDSTTAKLKELKELAELSEDEPDLLQQIQDELNKLATDVERVELQSMLAGPFDRNNAILSINAGAGGTESCDWASMLLRMYIRWGETHDCQVTTLDILHGEEAGIKN